MSEYLYLYAQLYTLLDEVLGPEPRRCVWTGALIENA